MNGSSACVRARAKPVCACVCVCIRCGGDGEEGLACTHTQGGGGPRGGERRAAEATEVALGSWGRPGGHGGPSPPWLPSQKQVTFSGGTVLITGQAPVLQLGHHLPGDWAGVTGGRGGQASPDLPPWEAHSRGSTTTPVASLFSSCCFFFHFQEKSVSALLTSLRITRIKRGGEHERHRCS